MDGDDFYIFRKIVSCCNIIYFTIDSIVDCFLYFLTFEYLFLTTTALKNIFLYLMMIVYLFPIYRFVYIIVIKVTISKKNCKIYMFFVMPECLCVPMNPRAKPYGVPNPVWLPRVVKFRSRDYTEGDQPA